MRKILSKQNALLIENTKSLIKQLFKGKILPYFLIIVINKKLPVSTVLLKGEMMKQFMWIMVVIGITTSCAAMQESPNIITINADNIHEFHENIKEIIWNCIDPIYLPEDQEDAKHTKDVMMQEFNDKTRQAIVMVDELNHYLAHIFFVIQANGHIKIASPGYKDKSLVMTFLQKALDKLESILTNSQEYEGIQRKIIVTYPQNYSAEVDHLLKLFNFIPDNNVEEPGYKDRCLNVYKYPAHFVENVQFYSRQHPA